MRIPALSMLAAALLGCADLAGAERRPPPVAQAQAEAIRAASERARAAGYPDEDLRDVRRAAEKHDIPPDVLAQALDAAAEGAQRYGPVGDLDGYLTEVLYRYDVRGPWLSRMIVAHHTTMGARRLGSPPGPASPAPAPAPGT